MKKSLVILISAAFVFIFTTGCSQTPSGNIDDMFEDTEITEDEYMCSGAYSYYYFPQNGRDTMPIGAWCAPPTPNYADLGNPDYITDESYKIMSESGLNSIYALYDQAQNNLSHVLKAHDYADKYGLVYLVRDQRILAASDEEELFESLFSAYTSKPAYGGNLVMDEPGTASFKVLGNMQKVWNKNVPDTLMYVNLLPLYASDNQLVNGAAGGTAERTDITYEKYLEEYISTVKPKILSFDYYPFNGYNKNVGQSYFTQLSLINKKAGNANIPFWTFSQAGFFDGEDTRPITEAEFMWQCSTALAYGAKGIQYFNYWQPLEIPGNNCGFVDKQGQKTYIYNFGVKMNSQIAAADEVLMKSAQRGVMVSGSSPAPIPENDILSNFNELSSVTGDGVLVGCFDYRGKTALYIVANSLSDDVTANLQFNTQVTALLIENGQESQKSGSSLTLNISKGEGILVVCN